MQYVSPILYIVVLVCMNGFAPAQNPPGLEPLIQTGHTQRITSVALSDDGKVALTGSWDKTAILWHTASGKRMQTFQGTNEVTSVGHRTVATSSRRRLSYIAGSWS